MPEKILLVESPARFIHQILVEHMGVRNTNRMVLTRVLRQPQTGVMTARNRVRSEIIRRRVIGHIGVVVLAEVVIQSEGAEIEGVTAGDRTLVLRNPAVAI